MNGKNMHYFNTLVASRGVARSAANGAMTALVLLLLTVSLTARGANFPPLVSSVDDNLQQAMTDALGKLHLKKAVADKRLAVTLVDITDLQNPRFAEVNGDVMLYAASLPKIAILLGALQRVNDGSMEMDAELRSKLTRMIRNSSNQAASEVLAEVGEEYLANLLQSDDYQLYKPDRGGLWVGKPYGKAPAWKRDPLHNISHGATSNEVARFYYLLATDRLVSEKSCTIMSEILSDPAINHKFVKGMRSVHPEARIYRKSGTWRTYHSDGAIIEHDDRRYIVVGLANDAKGGKWLEQIVVAMDRIVSLSPEELVAQSPAP